MVMISTCLHTFAWRKKEKISKLLLLWLTYTQNSYSLIGPLLIFTSSLERCTSWWPPLCSLCQDLLYSQPLSSLSSQDICSHIQHFVHNVWLVCKLILLLARIMCVMCLSKGTFLFLVCEFLFSCSLSSLKHSPSKWTTGGKEPQMHPWGSPQQPSAGGHSAALSQADAV